MAVTGRPSRSTWRIRSRRSHRDFCFWQCRDDDLVEVAIVNGLLDGPERVRAADQMLDRCAGGGRQQRHGVVHGPVGGPAVVDLGVNSVGSVRERRRTSSSRRGVDAVRLATINTCLRDKCCMRETS
jgi:hypothetical protein